MERESIMIEKPIDVTNWTRFHDDKKHPYWWGILGMIVIESTVILIFLASFFYLWVVNVSTDRMGWPPEGTVLPPLLYPSLNIVLLGICAWSMWYGGVVMKRGRNIAFAWLVVLCCGCSALLLYFRWLQFEAFSFNWKENAYASFVWILTAFHFMHVAAGVLGTALIGWLAYKGYYTRQRMLGVTIDTIYWYYIAAGWLPIYFVLYWAPRLQ